MPKLTAVSHQTSLIFAHRKAEKLHLTRQLQARMHSCIFDHGRGVTSIIHVLFCALSLPVDHCQSQPQPLSVGLSPAGQPQHIRKMLS